MNQRYRIGVIGYGNMGRGYVEALLESSRWEVAAVCDAFEPARGRAAEALREARIYGDAGELLADSSLDVVGLFTLADARPEQIRAALRAGKHVIAEKPIAADIPTELELLKEIEEPDSLVAVNLFNRNAWYHAEMRDFIARGEIGKLGILRVCHLTAGLLPGEGHGPEGAPFHDCGMHYVDVARWYAGSEYARWNAQGVRLWGEEEPWWVGVNGEFENGVVFEISQGFVYGLGAKQRTENCSFEAIGTQGIVRMRHDFETVTMEMHGVSETVHKTGPYGGKKLGVMIDLFARSLDAGRNLGFPGARDSVIASEVSQRMLEAASAAGPPVIGTVEEARQLLEKRRAG